MRGFRPLWLGLALLVAVAATLAIHLGSALDDPTEPAGVMPPGFWVRSGPVSPPAAEPGMDDPDEAARVLSLPYASTGRRAPAQHGVVFHDPDRTWGTYNLYSSGHGPEAILVDMEGRFLHRWRLSYELAFPERDALDLPYWRRVRLLGDGSLVVLFQGGGLIRVDQGSDLLWRLDRGTYNDLRIAADGTILTITKSLRRLPAFDDPVLEDAVLFVSPDDGRPLRQVSILGALLRSPYASVLDARPPRADVLHVNTLEPIERDDLPAPFLRGRILFSAREPDLLGLLDVGEERVVWARQGPWLRQHEPRFLENGHLLLFDNQGGPGGRSRILELDPASLEIAWSFAHPSFDSPQAGTCARLPNGNTLITSSEGGRAFEITRDGEVVWELVSPHRGGRDDELVAALWEVIRLGEDAVPWLDER